MEMRVCGFALKMILGHQSVPEMGKRSSPAVSCSVLDWSGTDGISDSHYRVGELDKFRFHGLSIQLPFSEEEEEISYFSLYRGNPRIGPTLLWCAPHGPGLSSENYFSLADGSFVLVGDGLYVAATTNDLIRNTSMSVFYT